MGMPITSEPYYTRDMVLALPEDGNRYELVYGELLVSPAPVPRHQVIVGRLYAWIFEYLERERVGRVFLSPADITWGRKDDVLVQPDVFVGGMEDATRKLWKQMRHFLLFAEVLSPSTSRNDRFTKRGVYQERRVPVYWVLDPERRTAEIWTPEAQEPTIEVDRLVWHPEGAVSALTIDLERLFAP